jgi:hypothetical protein
MTNKPSNTPYGLNPKESRKLGLVQPSSSNPKDVELEAAIARQIRGMGNGKIRVRAKAGKISLSGVVDDFGTKRSIADVVRTIPGVRKILNEIKVLSSD